jgi:hypothetical protein
MSFQLLLPQTIAVAGSVAGMIGGSIALNCQNVLARRCGMAYRQVQANTAELPGVRRRRSVTAILNERGLLLKMVYHYDRAL